VGCWLAWLCLRQGADLHVAQLMALALIISCSSKSRLVLPFWCRLTWVVPDKIQECRKMVVCVCACVCVLFIHFNFYCAYTLNSKLVTGINIVSANNKTTAGNTFGMAKNPKN